MGTCNRHVKLGRKIRKRLGKMPENLGGVFLTHTVLGDPKKRGHSAFCRISRKLRKIDFLHTSRLVYAEYVYSLGLVTLFHTVAPSGES